MRSERVVIAGVGRKNLAQMGFAEDDDVIEAFPGDRADQSLRMPILPRRPRGDQKGLPSPRRPSPTLGHILGHRRLRDIDAQLEQFAVDAGRTPQPISQAHFPDQTADLLVSLADHPDRATSSANTVETLCDATG